jgi:hypothetical protein
LCYSERWRFVPDFLLDYIPTVFGKPWGDAELAKPETERHPLVQWRVEGIRYMNAQPRQADGYYAAVPNGPLAAYMAFAFNLFAIEDNSRFDDPLLERLKNKDQFQGARHEVFVEATCLRAGFAIEHEDEGDRTRRHAEFTARHRATGQLLSVEAKSKHRAGVLGQRGRVQAPEKLSLRFGGLLNDAIAKRDYILDITSSVCYAFFMDGRSNLAMWLLTSLCPLAVNKCRIASSVVMSFGCFLIFFFMVAYGR